MSDRHSVGVTSVGQGSRQSLSGAIVKGAAILIFFGVLFVIWLAVLVAMVLCLVLLAHQLG